MEENRLAPCEGGLESSTRVRVDWICLLQMLAFSLVYVLRIPFALSDAIPNARLFKWFDKYSFEA